MMNRHKFAIAFILPDQSDHLFLKFRGQEMICRIAEAEWIAIVLESRDGMPDFIAGLMTAELLGIDVHWLTFGTAP